MVDGYSFPNLTKRVNIAGRHITAYLVELLLRRGYSFNKSADFDTVRHLKEKMCFVALDYAREAKVIPPPPPPDPHVCFAIPVTSSTVTLERQPSTLMNSLKARGMAVGEKPFSADTPRKLDSHVFPSWWLLEEQLFS